MFGEKDFTESSKHMIRHFCIVYHSASDVRGSYLKIYAAL